VSLTGKNRDNLKKNRDNLKKNRDNLKKNVSQCYIFQHKSHIHWSEIEPGSPPPTNSPSHGMENNTLVG
jgi:hypothetical protein